MADSFEKRQRERRKAEKRKDKVAKKAERKDLPGDEPQDEEFATPEAIFGDLDPDGVVDVAGGDEDDKD